MPAGRPTGIVQYNVTCILVLHKTQPNQRQNLPLVDVSELHVAPPQPALAIHALGHRVEGHQLHAAGVRVTHLGQHLGKRRSNI